MNTIFKNYEGVALIEKSSFHTYKDLTFRIESLAFEIKNSIEDGDIICIKSDYSFDSIALFLALSQRKCIIVPVVPTTDAEFQSKIVAASVHKVISLKKDVLEIDKIIRISEEIPEKYLQIMNKGNSGLVLFSSGTTGVPKVMVHDLTVLIESFKIPKKQRRLNFLLFLLFDHIGGVNTLLNCLSNGSQITIPQNRNPEYILQLVQDKKVQVLPTTPTFLNLILMTENFGKYNISSLKMITYGTERMPQMLLDKLKNKIPHVKLLQTFGTSETGIMKTQSKSSASLFFKIIDPDYQYKIVENQLYLKSKNQIKGYINQKSAQFLDHEWFATGDIVATDDEGYIKIIGRINNVINIGGQKVLPKEVEDVINEIAEIIDTTVYSKSNIITGQMVCADVVISDATDKINIKKKIIDKCKKELDKYKIPSKITISTSLSFSNRFKKTNK